METKPRDWLEDNVPLVLSIYDPLSNTEANLFDVYDDVFRDSIRENTINLLYSMICIEYSRSTGQSTEEFYGAIDTDELYDFVVRCKEIFPE